MQWPVQDPQKKKCRPRVNTIIFGGNAFHLYEVHSGQFLIEKTLEIQKNQMAAIQFTIISALLSEKLIKQIYSK